NLYETDFYAWIFRNIELLKQRSFSKIDVDILIDELESMAKRDKRELVSHFIILLAHLLKWQFQLKKLTEQWQTQQGSSWRGSITEQRLQIIKQLTESSSLKNYLTEAVENAYPDAIKISMQETQISRDTFPKICSYTIEQLLDENFYPVN
ncbi:MAG: DUF29 domain-containing protein, partial [Bacteroidales bacterium]|nr:DUF29 domain-containing protein [Bacteroidales bacterium]